MVPIPKCIPRKIAHISSGWACQFDSIGQLKLIIGWIQCVSVWLLQKEKVTILNIKNLCLDLVSFSSLIAPGDPSKWQSTFNCLSFLRHSLLLVHCLNKFTETTRAYQYWSFRLIDGLTLYRYMKDLFLGFLHNINVFKKLTLLLNLQMKWN